MKIEIATKTLKIRINSQNLNFFLGGLRTGPANTRVGFGGLGRPTNTFGISPETIETLASDPTFNQARSMDFLTKKN